MSAKIDPVKRWDFKCELIDINRFYVDLDDYDAVVKERDDLDHRLAEAHHHALNCQRRAEKAEAERDALKARCERQTETLDSQAKMLVDDRYKHTQIYVRNTELVKEVDALKATVERVREVLTRPGNRGTVGVGDVYFALAPQGEGKADDWKPCCLPHPHHVHCCHPERRGTTGFDGRGRRESSDREPNWQGHYNTWDRRKSTRRGGRG